MPTENRSSNTEMVSVPRALAERISNICMFTMYKEDWRALSEILAKPAEQHQGEPVALPERHVHEHHGCFLSERQHGWNACLDEIAKLGPLYTRPVQGEPVAWQDPDNDSRMCTAEHKAYALSKGGAPAAALATLTRPLYTHADPGEVERIENERAEQWRLRRDAEADRDTKAAVIAELRAQLAERDVLLREVLVGLWPSTPLAIKINAAVSGSAAPGGSQHKLAMDAACGEIEALRAQLAALRELKLPEFLKLSEEMRAAGERAYNRAKEDGCYSFPILQATFFEAAIQRWLDDQEEVLSASAEPKCGTCHGRGQLRIATVCGPADKSCPDCASAEPSAPVERDEQALIELALSEYGKTTGNHVLPGGFNEKQDSFVQGFLVCATLDRKPS